MSAPTHTALIAFAPLWTYERHNDPRWNRAGRTLYEAGSLKMRPSVTEIPLLVDHDDNRRIGTVTELTRIEWPNGPWVCARATITDAPPWLRNYTTKASFRHATYGHRGYTDGELISAAVVSEISILSPGVEPDEPLAQVLLIERSSSPAAALSSDRAVVGEPVVFYGSGEELWRGEQEIIHTPRVLVRRRYDTSITIK